MPWQHGGNIYIQLPLLYIRASLMKDARFPGFKVSRLQSSTVNTNSRSKTRRADGALFRCSALSSLVVGVMKLRFLGLVLPSSWLKTVKLGFSITSWSGTSDGASGFSVSVEAVT